MRDNYVNQVKDLTVYRNLISFGTKYSRMDQVKFVEDGH